jgi:uncharacterized protein (TIGR03032 family)
MTSASLQQLFSHQPVLSDGFKLFLREHDASLAVAAGHQLWLFTVDADGLPRAMEIRIDDVTGLAWHEGRLWVASHWQLWAFVDVLSQTDAHGGSEHLLVPQSAHTTGHLAVTDLVMTRNGPVLVSALFSCLATLDAQFSIRPIWAPPQLSALLPESRWHLTGAAVRDDVVAFVSSCGQSNEPGGWRETMLGGGCIIDTDGSIVTQGLTVPRQIRWHNRGLIVADSGSGRLLRVDPADGSLETIATLPGVLGSLDVSGDFAIVGHGDPSCAAAEGLPGGHPSNGQLIREGISIVSLNTGLVTGSVEFLGESGPVHAVALLHGARRSSIASPRGLTAQNAVTMAAPQPLASSGFAN